MQLIQPTDWKDYQLIDCGDKEKIERFGEIILIRPEPQALWQSVLSKKEWHSIAHAHFTRDNTKISNRGKNTENSGWQVVKKMPETWNIGYTTKEYSLTCKLALTSFGHVGVFPEQANNWNFIYSNCKAITNCKVLNLFAYTGMASLAAKAANADVTHLDSVKQIVNWANTNMKLSSLDNIRWVIEDATKFVKRESNRGNKYNGIILDPPAYGRGANGEKWELTQMIGDLMSDCYSLLSESKAFVVLNMYSLGHSALISNNILHSNFKVENTEYGEFYIESKYKTKLPLGNFARFSK
jgi:23S rRNA (cytosine1962-C5)-methyltransferase